MSGDLAISFTVVSLLLWVMMWLLGTVKNMRPETENNPQPGDFIAPALLYGSAELLGVVGLIFVSYIVLPKWGDNVLAHLGLALFVVQSVIVVLAPFIAGLTRSDNRVIATRKLMTAHGLMTFWFLWLALLTQFFVDHLERWTVQAGGVSLLFAFVGSVLLMFFIYWEFMWIMGRKLSGAAKKRPPEAPKEPISPLQPRPTSTFKTRPEAISDWEEKIGMPRF